jgi:hypothetical protein
MYLCLDHAGFAGEQSRRELLKLFVKPSDYYVLGKTHINVENILTLLQNNPAFFHKINEIKVGPGDGKYKKLVGWK